MEYAAAAWELNLHDICLVVAPIGHDLTFTKGFTGTLSCSGRVVMLDSTTADSICAAIQEEKVTALPCVPTLAAWQALWEASGLQERVVRTRQVDAGTEIKRRIEWIGWRWLLSAWGRALRLYITNPAIRQSIKEQLDVPPEAFQWLGYGLFVGKK